MTDHSPTVGNLDPPRRWVLRQMDWVEALFVTPGSHLTKFGWLIVTLLLANVALDVVKWFTYALDWVLT